ncbi:hypothetical protein M8J75_015584 [Diaphorina citri]|nr:hypothetical protein M8J75_015584 [Diaphorina citri]
MNKTNNIEAYKTVLDIDQLHLTRGANANTNHPNQTINNEAFKSIINPEVQNSEVNDENIDTVDTNIYKIRYEEMNKLKDSLIEKILEKERVILRQENEIKELKTKAATLEKTNMEQSNSTQIESLLAELEHVSNVSKQLMTTISTLEAGWEVDKKELDKLKKKSKDNETMSLRPEGLSQPVPTPHSQPQQCKAGPSRIQLTIIGDSHVRSMDTVLASKLPAQYDVKSYFKPGSKVAELNDIRTRSHNHQDIIILFSGTNDISKTSMKSIKESFVKIIDKNKHCKIGVVLVPLRKNTCNINTHIKDFNAQLVHFFKDKPVFIVDPTKILNTNDYSNDNLHLNKTGKNKLGQIICNKLTNTEQRDKNPNTKTTPKVDQEQKRVNFETKYKHGRSQHQNRYSRMTLNNKTKDSKNKYNKNGYINKYKNNRYDDHSIMHYNYNNRRYDHYHKLRYSYYQYPHSSHHNRYRYVNNRITSHTRRYHSHGGWDSAREEDWGNQNRFFRKY